MEFRILLVDDEDRLTSVLSQFFLEKGYQVQRAASGDEALAILARQPADLMILDLHMPGLPGEEVLKRVKTKAPQVKVIVLTAYPERERAVRALGCDAFFTKPFATDKLIEFADRLLTRKDEDELKKITMGMKLQDASPGEPLALLLLIEPFESVASILLRHLGDASQAKGVYKVEHAANVEQAVMAMTALQPDIVLLDAMTVNEPGEAIRKLLDCPSQPKDYILYMHPNAEEDRLLNLLPAKKWQGNLWKDGDLQAFMALVRQTALEHDLVKR
ncbi:MAG: response regulator [Candidatus Omnitrophica bacterium]|nr:response regulator [Candidatus Omnitrophota bacterium]